MDMEGLQTGDMVFGLVSSHVGVRLSEVTQSPYSHVFVIIDRGKAIEAAPGGVRVVAINQEVLDSYLYLDVFRLRMFQGDEGRAARQRFERSLVSKVGCKFYGPLSTLLLIAWTYLRIRWLKRRFAWQLPGFRWSSRRSGRFSCASLISRALIEVFGELPTRPGLVAPIVACAAVGRDFWREMVANGRRLRDQRKAISLPRVEFCEVVRGRAENNRDRFLRALARSDSGGGRFALAGADCMPTDLLLLSDLTHVGRLTCNRSIPVSTVADNAVSTVS